MLRLRSPGRGLGLEWRGIDGDRRNRPIAPPSIHGAFVRSQDKIERRPFTPEQAAAMVAATAAEPIVRCS